ncbi:MAG: glutamate--cysteine ligase [Planctomycetes bacterium]|nr:glutamate--cysteine ligase [Planctomycetota bacterium]
MSRLKLFAGFGIELEYMIVDRETLAVRPMSDTVLAAVAGEIVSEVEVGPLAWSNELVLHVIELKTNGPTPDLRAAAGHFQDQVRRIDEILAPHGARLMPTGMHPFMDPGTETVLWPHEYSAVYEQYHKIFDCRGHGWSNLQSMHINLPFGDDPEFERLHAAIRVLLPILPALTASTPIVEGIVTGTDDNRLRFYRGNSKRVPSVAGRVVPEPVFSRADYEARLLGGIYADMKELDPEGVLRFEFINARGAIARFDRYAIEIRVLDIQECPAADIAVASAIIAVLRALVAETWMVLEQQKSWDTLRLAAIFDAVTETSDRTRIDDADYCGAFGVAPGTAARVLWRALLDAVWPKGSEGDLAWRPWIDAILEHGTLAHRIVAATGDRPDRAKLHAVYGELCDCLHEGRGFRA